MDLIAEQVPAVAAFVQEAVEQNVGGLELADDIGHRHAARVLLAVADHDERLAAGDVAQLLAHGPVDGVEHGGAAFAFIVGAEARAALVDLLHLLERALELIERGGRILDEPNAVAEGGDEGAVLRAQHAAKESDRGVDVLLLVLLLATVVIEAEGERSVFIAAEGLDGLGRAVLQDFEVSLFEIRGEPARAVTDDEGDGDQVDVHFEGGRGRILGE